MNGVLGMGWARAVVVMAALLGASAAAAQVTFYAREALVGRSYAIHGAVPNLPATGLRERAASLSVRGGRWQVCTERRFRGDCAALAPGDYRAPAQMGLPARIGSAREVDWYAPAPGAAVGSVVRYEGPNLRGRSITVTGPTDGMGGFNGRARSMEVCEGRWELCEHDRYRGTWRAFAPGQLPVAAVGARQPHLVGAAHRQRVSVRRGAGVVVGRLDVRARALG